MKAKLILYRDRRDRIYTKAGLEAAAKAGHPLEPPKICTLMHALSMIRVSGSAGRSQARAQERLLAGETVDVYYATYRLATEKEIARYERIHPFRLAK